MSSIRDIHSDLIPIPGQSPLRFWPNSVKHLKLKLVQTNLMFSDILLCPANQVIIMRGNRRIVPPDE